MPIPVELKLQVDCKGGGVFGNIELMEQQEDFEGQKFFFQSIKFNTPSLTLQEPKQTPKEMEQKQMVDLILVQP